MARRFLAYLREKLASEFLVGRKRFLHLRELAIVPKERRESGWQLRGLYIFQRSADHDIAIALELVSNLSGDVERRLTLSHGHGELPQFLDVLARHLVEAEIDVG